MPKYVVLARTGSIDELNPGWTKAPSCSIASLFKFVYFFFPSNVPIDTPRKPTQERKKKKTSGKNITGRRLSVLLVRSFRGVAILELGVDTRKSKVVTARLRKGHSDKEPTTLTCLLMAGLRSGPGDSLKRLGFQVECLEVVCRTGLPSLTSVQTYEQRAAQASYRVCALHRGGKSEDQGKFP